MLFLPLSNAIGASFVVTRANGTKIFSFITYRFILLAKATVITQGTPYREVQRGYSNPIALVVLAVAFAILGSCHMNKWEFEKELLKIPVAVRKMSTANAKEYVQGI